MFYATVLSSNLLLFLTFSKRINCPRAVLGDHDPAFSFERSKYGKKRTANIDSASKITSTILLVCNFLLKY